MKNIIGKHVGSGNIIRTDFWLDYSFLSQINSGYVINNHSNGILGLASRIEGFWAELKNNIKKNVY